MNERDRLIALDAALCAAECCGNAAIKAAVSALQDELDKHFCTQGYDDSECLTAIISLAHNKPTWGGEV